MLALLGVVVVENQQPAVVDTILVGVVAAGLLVVVMVAGCHLKVYQLQLVVMFVVPLLFVFMLIFSPE